jgi:general stress protein YciG
VKARGFAAMSEERRREIASLGGRRAHELGRAYSFTSEKAKEAGREGGLARHRNRMAAQEGGEDEA